jgi:hypothetical protein
MAEGPDNPPTTSENPPTTGKNEAGPAEPTPAAAEAEERPPKSKGGRPLGAKDKQKRATPKRKPRIVEEPLERPPEPKAPDPPKNETAPDPPAPAREPVREVAREPLPREPWTPRSLLREASNLHAEYHRSRAQAKHELWNAHFERTLRPLHF